MLQRCNRYAADAKDPLGGLRLQRNRPGCRTAENTQKFPPPHGFPCILSTALAWRASMQITGRPSRLSSVHSHVAVGPVSRPIRTASGAFALTNAAIT